VERDQPVACQGDLNALSPGVSSARRLGLIDATSSWGGRHYGTGQVPVECRSIPNISLHSEKERIWCCQSRVTLSHRCEGLGVFRGRFRCPEAANGLMRIVRQLDRALLAANWEGGTGAERSGLGPPLTGFAYT